MKSKAGRKPTGEKAFTAVQKTQRQRRRNAFRVEAAKDNGYVPVTILMSVKQLESLLRMLEIKTLEPLSSLDNTMLIDSVFKAMEMLLEFYKTDLKASGHNHESVNACSYSNVDNEDFIKLVEIELQANKLFKAWELLQLNQPTQPNG